MIPIKNKKELEIMAESGKISAGALEEVKKAVKPGVSLLELNTIAEKVITESGAAASFKIIDNYNFATCLNVNEGLVHGVPTDYKLKVGDLVSLDMGAFYKGFHSDLSYTVEVETNEEEKFLNAGKKALEAGIENMRPGKRVGNISHAMQKVVEKAGYTVSRELVGHGIGKELHEDPYVPGYGVPRKGPKIEEGMVFAIEIIYQKGRPEIEIDDEDDWTIRTADGSLAALFEHTVAATKSGPVVLTK